MTTAVIPQSVRTIANNAFQNNAITNITIGSGVAIGNNASLGNHGTPFLTAYNNGGGVAGTYTWSPGFLGIGQGSWTRQP